MKRIAISLVAIALAGCGAGASETNADRPTLAEEACKQDIASHFDSPNSVAWRNVVRRQVVEDQAWDVQGEASTTDAFTPWTCLAVYDPEVEAMRVDKVQLSVD